VFNNKRDIVCVWSLACLVISSNKVKLLINELINELIYLLVVF
jgi:hypothetical protein